MKSKTCTIHNDVMNELFPSGNQNNRKRSEELLTSGSEIHSSLQHVYCSSRLEDLNNIFLFNMDMSPSMKSKVNNASTDAEGNKSHDFYTAFLAFDLESKKNITTSTLCVWLL